MGGANAQWTYPIPLFGLNPFTITILDNMLYQKIFYLWIVWMGVGVDVCACVCINGLLYLMLLLSEKI